MRYASCLLLLPITVLALMPAAADERAAVGSLRLRGGFDANPTLLPGGRGSAFGGVDGVFAVGRETKGLKVALLGEVERTEYVERG